MSNEVKGNENVSTALEKDIGKNGTKRKASTGVHFLFLIICFTLIAIVTAIGLKVYNNKISNKSFQLTREGELEKSLNVADKILFNEKEKLKHKRLTVLSSYLFDCKRAAEEYDSKIFDKWFGDGGELFIYDCKFYTLPPQDGYYDYPYCILSCDNYYLLFYYDSEKKHYVAFNEVKGLKEDLTPDKEFTLDSDEKWSEIWRYNENKETQNKIRNIIKAIYANGNEIESCNTMWAYVKYEDAYKTAPLLDGYSKYNF